jgi:hypothetical protein
MNPYRFCVELRSAALDVIPGPMSTLNRYISKCFTFGFPRLQAVFKVRSLGIVWKISLDQTLKFRRIIWTAKD